MITLVALTKAAKGKQHKKIPCTEGFKEVYVQTRSVTLTKVRLRNVNFVSNGVTGGQAELKEEGRHLPLHLFRRNLNYLLVQSLEKQEVLKMHNCFTGCCVIIDHYMCLCWVFSLLETINCL